MTQTEARQEIATRIPPGTWRVDPAHSSVEFGIQHLLITTVKGTFAEFDGAVVVDDDGNAGASGVIRAATIDTNEPQRDEHLRSPDFFDAERFPEIRVEAKEIAHVAGNRFRTVADVTIRGETRQLELDVGFEGTALDPYGNERIGLTLRGELDPTEYGVDWNQELETGGNLIGDRVRFTANISAVRAG